MPTPSACRRDVKVVRDGVQKRGRLDSGSATGAARRTARSPASSGTGRSPPVPPSHGRRRADDARIRGAGVQFRGMDALLARLRIRSRVGAIARRRRQAQCREPLFVATSVHAPAPNPPITGGASRCAPAPRGGFGAPICTKTRHRTHGGVPRSGGDRRPRRTPRPSPGHRPAASRAAGSAERVGSGAGRGPGPSVSLRHGGWRLDPGEASPRPFGEASHRSRRSVAPATQNGVDQVGLTVTRAPNR